MKLNQTDLNAATEAASKDADEAEVAIVETGRDKVLLGMDRFIDAIEIRTGVAIQTSPVFDIAVSLFDAATENIRSGQPIRAQLGGNGNGNSHVAPALPEATSRSAEDEAMIDQIIAQVQLEGHTLSELYELLRNNKARENTDRQTIDRLSGQVRDEKEAARRANGEFNTANTAKEAALASVTTLRQQLAGAVGVVNDVKQNLRGRGEIAILDLRPLSGETLTALEVDLPAEDDPADPATPPANAGQTSPPEPTVESPQPQAERRSGDGNGGRGGQGRGGRTGGRRPQGDRTQRQPRGRQDPPTQQQPAAPAEPARRPRRLFGGSDNN